MRLTICGIGVDFVSQDTAMAAVREWVSAGGQRYITTPNPEIVMKAQTDPDLARTLSSSDLAIADGVGLIWAARRLYGRGDYPRLSGVDLMQAICEVSAAEGWRIFLLGGTEQVSLACKKALEQRYAGISICGSNSDQFTPASAARIREDIQASGPVDIVFVAYGAPKQECWISTELPLLPDVRLAMVVGGSFDFLSGRSVRAPQVLRRVGLEWLYRLVREPWRLCRMMALPRFVLLVLKQKVKKGTIGKLS